MKTNQATKIRRRWAKAYLFGILALIVAPFVVQREFYPFMQFVMFASKSPDNERFEVVCDGQTFDPRAIGLDQGKFHVICRRYWYTSKSGEMLRELSRVSGRECMVFWRISGEDTTRYSIE